MKMTLPTISLLIAAAAAQAQVKTCYVADAYRPVQTMPFNATYGSPVGTEGTLTVRLPEDYDAGSTPRAALWMNVDDIDDPKEALIYINTQGPQPLSPKWIAEGIGHRGFIELPAQLLHRGDNEIRCVFADNLGGTTRGFEIHELAIVLARSDEPKTLDEMAGERDFYLDLPDFGTLAIYESSHTPVRIGAAQHDGLTWMPHIVQQGDGQGGWTSRSAEFRFVHIALGKQLIPFGLAQMDNGRVLMLCSLNDGQRDRPVISTSDDGGDTWSDWQLVKRAYGRPMMLAYAGGGNISFDNGRYRVFSADYGETFRFRTDVEPTSDGGRFHGEGNPLVERDSDGTVHVATVGYNFGPPGAPEAPEAPDTPWKIDRPTVPYFRWSHDGGHRWQGEVSPDAWRFDDHWQNSTYPRAVSEGSLVRAAGGALVAALRTNTPPWMFHTESDNMEGIGVSLSYDNGNSWGPIDLLFRSGRMHPHLLRLKDDRLVMSYVVRQDLSNEGRYNSFNRGVEAIVSTDHGVTWDTSKRYLLDQWMMFDPANPFATYCGHTSSCVLDDGRILTAYGHCPSKSVALIRWTP